jgi:hypothetical protein
MPYESIWEKSGLFTRWWGQASSAELHQMQEKAHAHPNFDLIRYSLHDFSECERFSYSQDDVAYSAAIDSAASLTNPQVKIAIVAANEEVVEAVREYLKAKMSPYPLRFFNSVEEARAWIK